MEGTDDEGGSGVDVLATGPLDAPMVTMVVRVGVDDRLGGDESHHCAKKYELRVLVGMGVAVCWII